MPWAAGTIALGCGNTCRGLRERLRSVEMRCGCARRGLRERLRSVKNAVRERAPRAAGTHAFGKSAVRERTPCGAGTLSLVKLGAGTRFFFVLRHELWGAISLVKIGRGNDTPCRVVNM